MRENEPPGTFGNEGEWTNSERIAQNDSDIITNTYQYGGATVIETIDPSNRAANLREFHDEILVKEIEFITPEGDSFRLSSLLPQGYSFRKAPGKGGPYCEKDVIVYHEVLDLPEIGKRGELLTKEGRYFERPGSFFGLLHEIGHTDQEPIRTEDAFAQRWPRFVSLEKRETIFKSLLQKERDASAFALAKLRELRKQGIDLEPELTSRASVHEMIYLPLLMHEVNARDAVSKLQGEVYVKKTGRLLKEAATSGDFKGIMRELTRPSHPNATLTLSLPMWVKLKRRWRAVMDGEDFWVPFNELDK